MKHLCRQSIAFHLKNGIDRYGKPTFGVAVTAPCRAKNVNRRVARGGSTPIEEVIVTVEAQVYNDDGNLDNLATGDKAVFESADYRINSIYVGRAALGKEKYKTVSLTPWAT